jgi:hypothetical protein
MLTPEIVQRLSDTYHLAVGLTLKTPDGRTGILINVRFGDPDIGVMQFLNKENGVYFTERFELKELSIANV